MRPPRPSGCRRLGDRAHPGHPAGLNHGDTFAYALAVAEDEPLLFVGDGFSRTDVRVAAAPGQKGR